ncbi:hypothetical protein LSAT2_008200, partial [Lamellibrachia satsuma]
MALRVPGVAAMACPPRVDVDEPAAASGQPVGSSRCICCFGSSTAWSVVWMGRTRYVVERRLDGPDPLRRG